MLCPSELAARSKASRSSSSRRMPNGVRLLMVRSYIESDTNDNIVVDVGPRPAHHSSRKPQGITMAMVNNLISYLKDLPRDLDDYSEDRFQFMYRIVKDIADGAEANGSTWASEKCKRVIVEMAHWYD